MGVGYGALAIDALRSVVAELKRDNPLAPVTVLVPNNIAGIVARRALASGLAAGRTGIAGIHFTTLSRLAEQLAAPMMSPRTPMTDAALAAAWRAELADDPGLFGAVRDHPATIRALTAASRELGELTADELIQVETGGRLQQELVSLHRRVTDRIRSQSYDTVELLTAAAGAVATPSAGAVVFYLPQRLTPSEVALARAIANRADCTVILGLTGERRADAAVRASMEAVTGAVAPPGPTPPAAQQVRHYSDADEEVRGVVHGVLDALQETPAHRIAVLHAAAVPYARLLHEQFAAAGVQINGPGFAPVEERALSLGLLDVISLDQDLRRADLFRALSHAPVRDPGTGQFVPQARWERISRLAGVVGGPDWDRRLRRFADEQLAGIDDAGERGESDGRRLNAEGALALSAFAAELARRLSEGRGRTTWPALTGWATELFHDLYGGAVDLAQLPPAERYAADVIEQSLLHLGPLDLFETRADLPRLIEELTEELRSARPRVGRFGEGVFVGSMSAAVGLSVDAVFVVGLSEDTYPGRMRVDALLPDQVRDVVPELEGGQERLADQQRHLLAAFMSAGRVMASFARGDLRRNTSLLPSRWLLPTLRELTDDQSLAATQWARARSCEITGAPSYAATLGRSPQPATAQEWRVRSVFTGGARDSVVGAAADLLAARAGTAFTRYDGNLNAANDVPDPNATLLSATRLESYAACPHAYFVQRVLGVEPVEQPEETLVISALDIGTLMHEAMDEFVRHEHDRLPGYGQPWTKEQHQLLLNIGAAKATEFETRGLTGHPLLWAAERTRILADLGTMLDDDSQWRASMDARVVVSEMPFGRGDAPPVVLDLPSGRRIRLRGSADKVDQARDGTLMITDLKTGGSSHFSGLATDPTAAGTKLQLPLYAFAARQQLGDHPVLAQYWFVRKSRRADGPARIEVFLDADVEGTYLAVLDVLVEGMASGLFLARAPAEPDFAWVQCPYCNPDGLGHQAVRDRWEIQRDDPLLRRYVSLVEPS